MHWIAHNIHYSCPGASKFFHTPKMHAFPGKGTKMNPKQKQIAELSKYVDSFDLDKIEDSMEHSHVPYLVILSKAVAKWVEEKGAPPKVSCLAACSENLSCTPSLTPHTTLGWDTPPPTKSVVYTPAVTVASASLHPELGRANSLQGDNQSNEARPRRAGMMDLLQTLSLHTDVSRSHLLLKRYNTPCYVRF